MKSFGIFLGLVMSSAVFGQLHQMYEPTIQAAALCDIKPRLVEVSPRWHVDRDTPGIYEEGSATSELYGWRGERVVTQVLVEAPQGIRELRVEPCVLRGEGAEIPVDVSVVRYTLGAGKLVGDILEPVDASRNYPGIVRPLWLSIDIPANAPRIAQGTLNVWVNGKPLTLPLTLTMSQYCLPPPADWKCHLDLWQHPDSVARWHDVPMWSAEHLALLRPVMQPLAAMGQKTITATLIDEAWNEQTYDRFRGMVDITRQVDGTYTFDFTTFDTWVTFMREEIGLKNATINCYTMIPWTLTFPYFDAAQGKRVAPKMTPGSEAYEAFWGAYLTAFVAHLREKGWESITRIAMDERPDHLLRPALAITKKYAPNLQIVAACDAPSEINKDFADVSYIYNHVEKLFPVIAERRASGKTTTFYVCLWPQYPNTFMTSSLAEAEWLFIFAAHYNLDGFLRWAWMSWPENPLHNMDYGKFPSGDVSLIYPGGRLSRRGEALRQGIETFEKIRILREAYAAQPDKLAQLEAALKRFTVPRGHTAGVHEIDVEDFDTVLRTLSE